MNEFVDSDGDMMVGSDPIWMSTAEHTVLDIIERVGLGILEPFIEEVGVIGGLLVSWYPTPYGDDLLVLRNWL